MVDGSLLYVTIAVGCGLASFCIWCRFGDAGKMRRGDAWVCCTGLEFEDVLCRMWLYLCVLVVGGPLVGLGNLGWSVVGRALPVA